MELLASYCLTEPGAGSDAAALTTRALRDGDHYVLNGQKQFISGAGAGDLYVVMARTGGDGASGISALHRAGRHAGHFVRRQRAQDGLERPADARRHLRRTCACRPPTGSATEGIGFKIAMAGLDGGRLNIAACSLGGAQCGAWKRRSPI